MDFRENWTLETIFPGGVDGEAFRLSATATAQGIREHLSSMAELKPITEEPGAWQVVLRRHFELQYALHTPMSFTGCWSAVRASDTAPRTSREKLMKLFALLSECWVPIIQQMDQLNDQQFEGFIQSFPDERAALRRERMNRFLRGSESQETLIAQLNPQALHGWGSLYNLVAGRLKATLNLDNEDPQVKSIAEVTSLLSSPEESVRKAALEAAEEAWQTESSVCSFALNQITETRLKRNARSSVDELEHTLRRNRLDRTALEAMWAACDAARPSLLRYIDRKNALLGNDSLEPWNLRAPLQLEKEAPLSWEQACADIVASFHVFDPQMAQFAERALSEGWVDAKSGPNRRMGGFCASIPSIEESRIFMTFSGTLRSAMTLAHELGHAWHNEVLFDQAPGTRQITSSTAESASTFGEALFRDYMFEKAQTDAIRIQMLDQQLLAGVSFLMGLPVRFEFERALYLLAEMGPFTPKALETTWSRLWKQGFGGRLEKGMRYGWCSTLHYYISNFGFYNWPYTFGYLFSGHIYEQARAEGRAFQDTFRELLIGTGHMDSVPLAKTILGVDLTDPAFWVQSIQPLLDIEKRFMAMTEPLVTDQVSEA